LSYALNLVSAAPPGVAVERVWANMQTEAMERAYPLRVLRYRIRCDSGGAGLARGGDVIERDLRPRGLHGEFDHGTPRLPAMRFSGR
jgi:hypothetical protein